jgi:hypothetical protein
MWRKLASFSTAAREYIIAQNTEIIDLQQRTEAKATSTAEQLHEVHADVQQLEKTLTEFVSFAQTVWRDVYDKLLDVRPPSEHVIDDEVYPNPFALARAEDFNHNYSKLAKLFQESPDWYAIQDRTNNLILEGGRGTGKSTILRRLTVQASVAAARLSKPDATFDSLQVDYFGIYAKITRGYHDQQLPLLSGSDAAVSLLAQQELNLAIFDSFVEALIWVQSQHALGALDAVAPTLIKDLNSLFPKAPVVHTFQELKNVVCGFEQDQINEYHRVVAFPSTIRSTPIGAIQEASLSNSRD